MGNEYYVGLMSGTSLDGIDAVLVDFSSPRPQTVAAHHLPYDARLRQTLLELSHAPNPALHDLAEMDVRLGRLYAQGVRELLQVANCRAEHVRAVGCHGQTIRHNPHGNYPYTVQIGDPNVVAEHTGITTVADFRRRDVAAGGQGAPLVPAFHAALFRHPGRERVVLNLGGMANICRRTPTGLYLASIPARPMPCSTAGRCAIWVRPTTTTAVGPRAAPACPNCCSACNPINISASNRPRAPGANCSTSSG